MWLLAVGATYAVCSFVLICSICGAAVLPPQAPSGGSRPSPSGESVESDADGLGRVYELTSRR